MPITLPSFVAPNEVIESAWGNAVVDALDELDDEKLNNNASDEIAGTLTVNPTGSGTGLSVKQGSEEPSIRFRSQANTDMATMIATASEFTIDTLSSNPINVTAPMVVNHPSGSIALSLYASTETPTLRLRSVAGTQLADLTASSSETILDTFGNNPFTIEGPVRVEPAGGSAPSLYLRGPSNDPEIAFASGLDDGYATVKADTNALYLQGDSGTGEIRFLTVGTERARFDAGLLLIGKTASNLATAGVEVVAATSIGSVRSTTAAASIQNVYCRHVSSADATSESYVEFARSSVIGSITQASTTTVAYNTSSDERLKTVLRDLDDEEIATILRMIAPVVFEFNETPGVEHVGFIAQQVAATWPSFVDVGIITPGHGEPGDEDVFDDEGAMVGRGFRPWMVDLSKLTPILVAGWQQLDRRLTALETR